MSKERRLGVLAIFLVGIFTFGAGIARMYLYLGTSYDIEDNPDFIGTSVDWRKYHAVKAAANL